MSPNEAAPLRLIRMIEPVEEPRLPRSDAETRDADLSSDDVAILACLADGATLHEVARRLHLSHRTASRRLSEICATLGVSRPIQAVAWAARRGLV